MPTRGVLWKWLLQQNEWFSADYPINLQEPSMFAYISTGNFPVELLLAAYPFILFLLPVLDEKLETTTAAI